MITATRRRGRTQAPHTSQHETAPERGGSSTLGTLYCSRRNPQLLGRAAEKARTSPQQQAKMLGNHEALLPGATWPLRASVSRSAPTSRAVAEVRGAQPGARLEEGRPGGVCGSGTGWPRKGAADAAAARRRAGGRPGAAARTYVLEAALLELLHRGVLGRLLQPLGAVGRTDVQSQHLAREDLLLLYEHRAAAAARPAPAARAVKVTGEEPGRPRAPSPPAAAAAPPWPPSASRPSLTTATAGALVPPPGRRAGSAQRGATGACRETWFSGQHLARRAGSVSRGPRGACRET